VSQLTIPDYNLHYFGTIPANSRWNMDPANHAGEAPQHLALANTFGAAVSEADSRSALGRRYFARLTMGMQVRGREEVRLRTIKYKVSRPQETSDVLLARLAGPAGRIPTDYPTGGFAIGEFTTLARKFTSFQGSFDRTSLAPLVERIALGLALSSWYDITAQDLAGGVDPTVRALGSINYPISMNTSTVFIPSVLGSVIDGDVFTVLAFASGGCGAEVVSDFVTLQLGTDRVLLRNIGARGFPHAAAGALRVLGRNMLQSGQGALYSLALTRGIHKGVKVEALMRDGEAVRRLLTAGTLGVPFGGIHGACDSTFEAIPSLQSSAGSAIASAVDAIALRTAASVAYCDPGVMVKGQWFPTTLSVAPHEDGDAGMDFPFSPAHARDTWGLVCSRAGPFFDEWVSVLPAVFGARAEGMAEARRVASLAVLQARDTPWDYGNNIVSPWFWVEPTSLLERDLADTAAVRHQNGAFTGPHQETTLPAWERARYIAGHGSLTSFEVTITSARRTPFLAFFRDADREIGCIRPTEMDDLSPVNVRHLNNRSLHDRLRRRSPLSDYIPQCQAAALFPPCSYMAPSGQMSVDVCFSVFDGDSSYTLSNLPPEREFTNVEVMFHVQRPEGGTPAAPTPREHWHAHSRTYGARVFLGVDDGRSGLGGSAYYAGAAVGSRAPQGGPLPAAPADPPDPPPRQPPQPRVVESAEPPFEESVLSVEAGRPHQPVVVEGPVTGPRPPNPQPQARGGGGSSAVVPAGGKAPVKPKGT